MLRIRLSKVLDAQVVERVVKTDLCNSSIVSLVSKLFVLLTYCNGAHSNAAFKSTSSIRFCIYATGRFGKPD